MADPYRSECPICKNLTQQIANLEAELEKAKNLKPSMISWRVGAVVSLLLIIADSFLATYVSRSGYEFSAWTIGCMILVFLISATYCVVRAEAVSK